MLSEATSWYKKVLQIEMQPQLINSEAFTRLAI